MTAPVPRAVGPRGEGPGAGRGGCQVAPARRALRGLASLAFIGTLAFGGCGGGPLVADITPPDPPAIPPRKPPPPDLLVARPAPSTSAEPVEISQASLAPLRAVSEERLHSVRAGETVYAISRLYGVPIRGLIDGNALSPPYTLGIGQQLKIAQPRSHLVALGDTVYGVSRRYGVDMTQLVRLNKIAAPYRISPGQLLLLPGEAVLTAQAPPAGAAANGTAPAQQASATAVPVPNPAPAPAVVPKPPPRAGGKFLWPVKGNVTSTYGPKTGGLHNDGINIAAPRGAEIRAAENGVVAYAGNELRGFGNLLLIKHAEGWMTAYAHTEAILVQRGDRVERGQVVARVGDSGSVATPQLHFEIRRGTRAVDPAGLLGPRSAT